MNQRFDFNGEMWILRSEKGYLVMGGTALVLCSNADDAYAVQGEAGSEYQPVRIHEPEHAADLLDFLRSSGLRQVAHKVPEGWGLANVETIIGKLLNQ